MTPLILKPESPRPGYWIVAILMVMLVFFAKQSFATGEASSYFFVTADWDTSTDLRLGSGSLVQIPPAKLLHGKGDAGKKVSVFEANGLETGPPGTSDIASMAQPGFEHNGTNPFTGLKFNQAAHLYLFARNTAHVTVKDPGTNGQTINRTYTILPCRYVDCFLTLSEWSSIYYGKGNLNSGHDWHYLLVESNAAISIFYNNFNYNWMAYFGSSKTQDFEVGCQVGQPTSIPGNTVIVNSDLSFTISNSIVDGLRYFRKLLVIH